MRFLLGYRHYPMSMARFFKAAMERLGHEVVSVGPYSGDNGDIPWPGGPKFPRYIDRPTIALPEGGLHAYPLAALARQLPGDFDAVWSFDAGFRLMGRLGDAKTVLYGTDPHALNYQPYYGEYDHFFSAQAQSLSMCPGAQWVPLAYDPTVHACHNLQDAEHRPVDVCFVGVMGDGPDRSRNAYASRWAAVQALKGRFNTFTQQGLIFDECTEAYNRSKIAFNWSSSWDLPMRLWEGAAYGCCVITNRLPYLEQVGFIDGETCIVYDTQEELLRKVEDALASGAWERIAKAGNVMIRAHTYDSRVESMLEVLWPS